MNVDCSFCESEFILTSCFRLLLRIFWVGEKKGGAHFVGARILVDSLFSEEILEFLLEVTFIYEFLESNCENEMELEESAVNFLYFHFF